MICYTTIATYEVVQKEDGLLYCTEHRYGGQQVIEYRFRQQDIVSVDFNFKGMIFLNVHTQYSTPGHKSSAQMRWDNRNWENV